MRFDIIKDSTSYFRVLKDSVQIGPSDNYTGVSGLTPFTFLVDGDVTLEDDVESYGILPEQNSQKDLGSSTYRWRTIYSTNTLNTSDERSKNHIKDLEYGLNELKKLNSKSYVFNDADNDNMGFIAQDVEAVMPELVHSPLEKGGYVSLNYYGIIPVIINSMQEQYLVIQKNKMLLNELKRELSEMNRLLDSLLESKS